MGTEGPICFLHGLALPGWRWRPFLSALWRACPSVDSWPPRRFASRKFHWTYWIWRRTQLWGEGGFAIQRQGPPSIPNILFFRALLFAARTLNATGQSGSKLSVCGEST